MCTITHVLNQSYLLKQCAITHVKYNFSLSKAGREQHALVNSQLFHQCDIDSKHVLSSKLFCWVYSEKDK